MPLPLQQPLKTESYLWVPDDLDLCLTAPRVLCIVDCLLHTA